MIRILSIIFASVFLFESSQAVAAVRFITDQTSFTFNSIGDSGTSYEEDDETACSNGGYKLTSCDNNQTPYGLCPQNPSYFQSCRCDKKRFPVTESKECGRFAAKESCTDSTGTHYSCTCSTNALTTCNGSGEYIEYSSLVNAQETLYFCRDSSNLNVTYYQKAICKTCTSPQVINSNRNGCTCPSTYIECEYGPEDRSDSCTENGVTKYKKCKSCANKGIYSSCPTGYACSLEQCSGKYMITGCATGYTDLSTCSWKCMFTKIMAKPETSSATCGTGTVNENQITWSSSLDVCTASGTSSNGKCFKCGSMSVSQSSLFSQISEKCGKFGSNFDIFSYTAQSQSLTSGTWDLSTKNTVLILGGWYCQQSLNSTNFVSSLNSTSSKFAVINISHDATFCKSDKLTGSSGTTFMGINFSGQASSSVDRTTKSLNYGGGIMIVVENGKITSSTTIECANPPMGSSFGGRSGYFE